MSTSHEPPAATEGLRERHAAPVSNDASSLEGTKGTEGHSNEDDVPEKEKKTFGRTPDGTGEISCPCYCEQRNTLHHATRIPNMGNLADHVISLCRPAYA
jgi:hypothetical protein